MPRKRTNISGVDKDTSDLPRSGVKNESGPSFFDTDDFRWSFSRIVTPDLLMKTRMLSKAWLRVTDNFIDERVESGELMVIGENDRLPMEAQVLEEGRLLVTQVVFLLNITKVGDNACRFAVDLVVVEIPEGVEIIGDGAFCDCRSLTTVSFPTILRLIGDGAFVRCMSLENVDLLNTGLQELGSMAFSECSELKSMTIPDSLRTLGINVFINCFKLAPSIDVLIKEGHDSSTAAVIAYLRSMSDSESLKKQLSEQSAKISSIVMQNESLNANVSSLLTMVTYQSSEITALKQTLQNLISSFHPNK
ncbi:hypothetical protein TrST_g10624 [Triparma strigata]|uniref:Uncharacterized protein n=1 Tax=Triparma strigata TaxID=1606541 RepID=A0A9W7ATI4_9STRA|nr:hypothetical protein TrST_g10624 [Triparma strigata]